MDQEYFIANQDVFIYHRGLPSLHRTLPWFGVRIDNKNYIVNTSLAIVLTMYHRSHRSLRPFNVGRHAHPAHTSVCFRGHRLWWSESALDLPWKWRVLSDFECTQAGKRLSTEPISDKRGIETWVFILRVCLCNQRWSDGPVGRGGYDDLYESMARDSEEDEEKVMRFPYKSAWERIGFISGWFLMMGRWG